MWLKLRAKMKTQTLERDGGYDDYGERLPSSPEDVDVSIAGLLAFARGRMMLANAPCRWLAESCGPEMRHRLCF